MRKHAVVLLVLLSACSSGGAEVQRGGSAPEKAVRETVPKEIPQGTIATGEEAVASREVVAGDLQFILPQAEDAGIVFAEELADQYVLRGEQPIGMEQTLWPWAQGFAGGWERTYDMRTGLAGPLRRVAVTSRVLLFQSDEDAVAFAKGLVAELGSAVRWTGSRVETPAGEITDYEFRTQYRSSGDALEGKSGAGVVREGVVLWTTFEDDEWQLDWGSIAWNANEALWERIKSTLPGFAQQNS